MKGGERFFYVSASLLAFCASFVYLEEMAEGVTVAAAAVVAVVAAVGMGQEDRGTEGGGRERKQKTKLGGYGTTDRPHAGSCCTDIFVIFSVCASEERGSVEWEQVLREADGGGIWKRERKTVFSSLRALIKREPRNYHYRASHLFPSLALPHSFALSLSLRT